MNRPQAARVAATKVVSVATLIMCLVGCSDAGSRGRAGSSQPASIISAEPVKTIGPAFSDNTGGYIGPADPDTLFSLSVTEVQNVLLKDGASAAWVASSASLHVEEGLFYALVSNASGQLVPSKAGTATYIFSGNTAPCPPTGGGVVAPGTDPIDMSGQICTGTVVADAKSGALVDVGTYGVGASGG